MSRFATIETSNSVYAPDKTKFVTVQSPALGCRGDIVIYNPAPTRPETPIIILLHGVYGSAWSWMFAGGAHQVYERLRSEQDLTEFVLVMPSDGLVDDGSGYLNRSDGDFENWIVDDVLELVLTLVSGTSKRSRVYICGLSMGGYGAIRLAFSHPNIFSGVSAHSAISVSKDFERFTQASPFDQMIANTDAVDLIDIIKTARVSEMPFRFDCGRSDPLYGNNLSLAEQLKTTGIPFKFDSVQGGHEWTYWNTNIARSFKFFSDLERQVATS